MPPSTPTHVSAERGVRDAADRLLTAAATCVPCAPVRDVLSEIIDLERSQMMPRATREFVLAFMENTSTPEQLAANIGYVKVKVFDVGSHPSPIR